MSRVNKIRVLISNDVRDMDGAGRQVREVLRVSGVTGGDTLGNVSDCRDEEELNNVSDWGDEEEDEEE